MSNVFIEENTLKEIANTIRNKTGKTNKMLPKEMINEISSISGTSTDSEKFIDGRLVLFEDDFDNNNLNLNNWIAENRGNFQNGAIQYYTSRKENIRVENSNLIITARKENYKNKTWTSGQVITRGLQEFKYGKIEARIKMPTSQGMWPAFWTLGRWYGSDSARQWPSCGEIDIVEHLNNDKGYYTVLHYNKNNLKDDIQSGGLNNTNNINYGNYNIYGVEWTESGFDFYINNILVRHLDTPVGYESAFRHAHSLLLSLQIGGWPGNPNNTTPDINEMYVDWVRVLAPVGINSRIYPTSIELSGGNKSIEVNESIDLFADCKPNNCTEQTIRWKSENPFIATVKGGTVKSLTGGDCDIYAIAKNGIFAKYNTTLNRNY